MVRHGQEPSQSSVSHGRTGSSRNAFNNFSSTRNLASTDSVPERTASIATERASLVVPSVIELPTEADHSIMRNHSRYSEHLLPPGSTRGLDTGGVFAQGSYNMQVSGLEQSVSAVGIAGKIEAMEGSHGGSPGQFQLEEKSMISVGERSNNHAILSWLDERSPTYWDISAAVFENKWGKIIVRFSVCRIFRKAKKSEKYHIPLPFEMFDGKEMVTKDGIVLLEECLEPNKIQDLVEDDGVEYSSEEASKIREDFIDSMKDAVMAATRLVNITRSDGRTFRPLPKPTEATLCLKTYGNCLDWGKR